MNGIRQDYKLNIIKAKGKKELITQKHNKTHFVTSKKHYSISYLY